MDTISQMASLKENLQTIVVMRAMLGPIAFIFRTFGENVF